MIKAFDLVKLSTLDAFLKRGNGALFAEPVSTRKCCRVWIQRLPWFRYRVSIAYRAVFILFSFFDDLLLFLLDRLLLFEDLLTGALNLLLDLSSPHSAVLALESTNILFLE